MHRIHSNINSLTLQNHLLVPNIIQILVLAHLSERYLEASRELIGME